MELSYLKCGDYYIPDFALPDIDGCQLGKYGRMRKVYLEGHHPIMYAQLVLTCELWPHLNEIDKTCTERMEQLIPAMAKQAGVDEDLKADNQMAWVGRMNSIRSRAEEIVLHELVYA